MWKMIGTKKSTGRKSTHPSLSVTKSGVTATVAAVEILGLGRRFAFGVDETIRVAVLVEQQERYQGATPGYKLGTRGKATGGQFSTGAGKQLIEAGVPPGIYELVDPPDGAPEGSVAAISWTLR